MKNRIISILILISLIFTTGVLANNSDVISQTSQVHELQDKLVLANNSEVISEDAEKLVIREEIIEKRELTSKTYKLEDGTYQYVGYSDDIHYLADNGKLENIDNSIMSTNKKFDSTEYKFKNCANSFNVMFADGNKTQYPVTIKSDDYSVSFGMNGISDVSVEKCYSLKSDILTKFVDVASSVVYYNVRDGMDLLYESSTDGIKEYIVLHNKPNSNKFEFIVKTTDVSPVKDENNNIKFVNESGKSIFSITNLFAIDAKEQITDKVYCDFVKQGDEYILTITVDDEYLYSNSREYPIIVDPSVLISSSSTLDSFVASKSPYENFNRGSNLVYLRTGRDSAYYIRRSYIKFNLPYIPSNSVTSAYLNMRRYSGASPDLHAYLVTSSWTSSGITWYNKASYNSSNYMSSISKNFSQYSSSYWYKMNVTEMVRRWVNGQSTNRGLMVRDDTEYGTSQWTTFYSSDASSPNKPELVINYSTTTDTYYGNRGYVYSSGFGQNCMGYACNYPEFINFSSLNLSHEELNNLSNTEELLAYIYDKSNTWMTENISYNTNSSYNSNISTNQYRIVLRVGYTDENENGQFDNSYGWGDDWDYHWWYQTNTGQWAEKSGSLPSHLISGTSGSTNPGSSYWYGYVRYDSSCKYFAVDN